MIELDNTRIKKHTSLEAEVSSKELLEALGLDSSKFVIHSASASVQGIRGQGIVTEEGVVYLNIRSKREREA